MAPILPEGLSARASGSEALAHEIQAEKAGSLGRVTQTALRALADLRRHDADPAADPAARAQYLRAAGVAVWQLFVQRESCGLRDHRPIIADFPIPREILRRLGAR